MTVSVTEAKNRLTELLVKVERGERVVIERYGKPVAEIGKPTLRRVPSFDGLKGSFTEIDPDWHRPQENLEAWLKGDL